MAAGMRCSGIAGAAIADQDISPVDSLSAQIGIIVFKPNERDSRIDRGSNDLGLPQFTTRNIW